MGKSYDGLTTGSAPELLCCVPPLPCCVPPLLLELLMTPPLVRLMVQLDPDT